MIVEHLVDHGVPPTGVGWHVYRVRTAVPDQRQMRMIDPAVPGPEVLVPLSHGRGFIAARLVQEGAGRLSGARGADAHRLSACRATDSDCHAARARPRWAKPR
jgi:hypothetical protein